MNRTPHRRSAVVLLAVAFLAPAALQAAESRNVLIVRGESADLPGGRILIDQIETTLRKSVSVPIEFYVETLDTARFTGVQYEERLADLFVEKYAGVPLDLVVAFSDPAVKFATRVRNTVFPGVPVLFGLVDRDLVDVKGLPSKSSIVYVQADALGTLRLARQVYPRVRRFLVVGGTSEFDRGWQRVIRQDLAQVSKEISVEYDVDSSLAQLAGRVASLPDDTAVFFVSMTRDAANTPLRPVDALDVLRAASPVPIFGLSSTYIGHGALGGSVLDFDRHGQDLARAAARIIAGGEPTSFTSPSSVVVDWRELQRFGIASAAVPAGAIVQFRDPGAWERQRGTIVVASLIVLAQTALIAALVVAGRRRRESQRELQGRLVFDRLLSDLSLAVVSVRPGGIDATLDDMLRRLAAGLGFEQVWRWKFTSGADPEWDSPSLRAGKAVFFDDMAGLPASLRAKAFDGTAAQCSAVAVPLAPGGIVVGALFWIARAPVSSWRDRLDELQMVSITVGNALQRRDAEGALERSDRLKSAILASLPAHVAVLDRQGAIIAANDAWAEFGRPNGLACAAGERGCATCPQAACTGAADALAAIEVVCAGSSGGRQMEYLCAAPDGQRWFLMTAEPLRRTERGAVITHLDITERKKGEIALRESEDRFRRMADALPLAIWMTDVDGGCVYVNRQGLELVGRELEDEIGLGWLENVHPADRVQCRQIFLAAFRERRGFRTEYRIQTPKGDWRWLMDTGMPRYGSDGAFHGYVGGCIDITDRKQAEDVLHGVNQRLMKAQDDERRRIARELHDHLSQQLALLAIDLQQMGMNPPKTVQAALPALQEAWRRTTEIASDVHAISHRLHPSKMEALGLVATARAHCRDVSRQSLAVQFTDENVPRDIAPDRALTLFRVLEEALSNVARHSGASSASVTLAGTTAEVVLRVVDDGRGFVSNGKPAGLGLISMRERVESLDGALSITTVGGKGTVLEARVPLSSMRATAPAGEPAAVPNLHS